MGRRTRTRSWDQIPRQALGPPSCACGSFRCRLTFDDGGATLDGTDVIQDVVRSPIFKRANYRSGHTQYGDAMQRAQFWDRVQTTSRGYHVLLSQPKVLPTASLQVPAEGGNSFQTANGPAGLVKTSYLISLLPLLDSYYEPNSVLTIVVKDVRGEDFLGFHFSFTPGGRTVPQTLIWTGYFTPGVIVGLATSDVYVFRHEVAEWINDPYLTNAVPDWQDPASGSCFSNLLEVADPVEFLPHHSFEVPIKDRTYHVTDVAGLSWFAHDVPSRELGGAYSYDGRPHCVLYALLTQPNTHAALRTTLGTRKSQVTATTRGASFTHS